MHLLVLIQANSFKISLSRQMMCTKCVPCTVLGTAQRVKNQLLCLHGAYTVVQEMESVQTNTY